MPDFVMPIDPVTLKPYTETPGQISRESANELVDDFGGEANYRELIEKEMLKEGGL